MNMHLFQILLLCMCYLNRIDLAYHAFFRQHLHDQIWLISVYRPICLSTWYCANKYRILVNLKAPNAKVCHGRTPSRPFVGEKRCNLHPCSNKLLLDLLNIHCKRQAGSWIFVGMFKDSLLKTSAALQEADARSHFGAWLQFWPKCSNAATGKGGKVTI